MSSDKNPPSMRFVAWYGIVVGTLMVVQWAFLLASGQVVELRSEPVRIAFHLAGELIAGVGLVVAGSALLRGLAWAKLLYLVAVGMVMYSEIVSPGYFAQKGQWGFVIMFAVLLAGAGVSVAKLARFESIANRSPRRD